MYVYMAQNCHFGFCVFLTGMVCTLLLPQWSWLLSTGLVLAAKVLFGIWAVGVDGVRLSAFCAQRVEVSIVKS